MRKALKYHYDMYMGLYVLVFLAVIACFGIWYFQRYVERKKALIRDWPLIEATVMKSEITYTDLSGSPGVNGVYRVIAEVGYEIDERRIKTKVIGSWSLRSKIDGAKTFEVGKPILLRVNPNEPTHASLIEITGKI